MHLPILLVILAFIRLSSALCPGFNYAFFGIPGGGNWRWVVTDNSCITPYPPCGNQYTPCHCPGLHCSAPPIHVDSINVNGLWYLCRRDPNAGSCQEIYCPQNGWTYIANNGPAGVAVEQCCRNDGRRNLEEGLINEREFQAIEATNALLDIHKRDYEEALAGGVSGGNLTALRDVQIQELKEAEKWQLMARLA